MITMKSLWKDIFREIKNTFGRFLSLLIITALGAASVVGIQASAIDMRDIADKTYKEHNLYDLQLKSSTGFDEDDIKAIKDAKDVLSIMPTYIFDVFINIKDEAKTVRTYALPDNINTVDIEEGRLPQKTSECAVEKSLFKKGNYKIGDVIKLSLDNMDDYNKVFNEDTFTIVGVVSSPLYVSHDRGRTSIGDGSLGYYMYLHKDAYDLDVYTDVYVLKNGSKDIYNLSEDYDDKAKNWAIDMESVGDARIEVQNNKLKDAKKDIDDGWVKYNDGVKELNEKSLDGKKQLDDAKERLEEIKTELENNEYQLNMAPMPDEQKAYAKAQIDAGWDAYNEGLDEYNKNLEKFNDEIADGQKKLDDSKKELGDSQKKLDDAPNPEWFYFTRKDGTSFDSYYQDTLRLQKIGYVFPMVFFLVAILVSLTSMSRMVEEHRMQMGVFKALGYKPFSIMLKYFLYAFSASLLGGVLGVLVGSNLFPRVISNAYGHLYTMPKVDTPIPIYIALIAIIAAVSSVVLVTIATCAGSMIGAPALLMRPKSPKAGKRVIIERIPLIWSKLGFIGKVTARNIFRYKRRFLMTLIGIAGCTALLLTAFGIRDSVGSVSKFQFEDIVKYDAQGFLKEITTKEQREGLDKIVPDVHLYIREESIDVKGLNNKLSASLIVPEFSDKLNDFINIYSSTTKKVETLSQNKVIITEKLARTIKIEIGDNINLVTSDGKSYEAKVESIAENYVRHYIYMSSDLYFKIFGLNPKYNNIFMLSSDNNLNEKMMKNDNVRAVVLTSDLLKNLSDSTDALGIVTIVLLVLACSLAFVVLFNLTNINITERIRELATIKVLGFHDNELALYVYRENAAVTIMGIALGLICGVFLDRFVLTSVEIDLLKFPLIIYPLSYVMAIALSLTFALFVNWVMNYKLANINMVESLKNVE